MQGYEDDQERGYGRRRKCHACGRNYPTIEEVDWKKIAPRKRGPKPVEDPDAL